MKHTNLTILLLLTLSASAANASDHAYFKGTTGKPGLQTALEKKWIHQDLLSETDLLALLGDALTDGLITGYDLRHKDVYADFAPGHTFIYSQSSAMHLKQLVSLMGIFEIQANVYVAPKVSAFLYREDWGSPGDHVQTLASGAQVVNGREMATLFEFTQPSDLQRFHDLILRYAKKDTEDETGLIADAWWQPFYYSDRAFDDFPSIDLVIVTSDKYEATLTVVHDKSKNVADALSGRGYPVRVEKVWVNPAFYRFLGGGYR